MEEIKSVRVRVNSSPGLDLKLTLFRENNRKRKVIVYPIGRLPGMEFGNRWRDSSDNEVINDYLSGMSKSGNLPEDYEIIQDPWEETVPKPRSFGFDPYYLNNGSRVYIDWVEGTNSAGGTKWSDQEGNELDETSLGENKSLVTKSVRIVTDSEILMINKNGTLSKYEIGNNQQGYQGSTVDDLNILEQLIFKWKQQVPNYDLKQCEPNNEFCSLIEYKSPLEEFKEDPLPPAPTEESTQGKETKIKLSVVLPEDLELKVKQDLDGIKVYVGDPPPPGGFIFQDEFDNLEELDPEYQETDFVGEEEVLNSPEQIAENESISNSNNTGSPSTLTPTGDYTSSLPNPTPDSNYAKNKVPYYNQYDTRWNKVIYGLSSEGIFIEQEISPEVKGKKVKVNYNGGVYNILCDHKGGNSGFSSIAGGGCGITSLSMVANYWAQKNNKGFFTSPIKMAKMVCELGGSSARPGPPCSGTNMYSVASKCNSTLSSLFGFKLKKVGKSEAGDYVKQGYPVIWGCKNGKAKNSKGGYKSYSGHFMVITEYRDGKFWINDPGNYSSKGCLSSSSFSEISSGSSYFFVSLPDQLA